MNQYIVKIHDRWERTFYLVNAENERQAKSKAIQNDNPSMIADWMVEAWEVEMNQKDVFEIATIQKDY
jgi:hypothetical protein